MARTAGIRIPRLEVTIVTSRVLKLRGHLSVVPFTNQLRVDLPPTSLVVGHFSPVTLENKRRESTCHGIPSPKWL